MRFHKHLHKIISDSKEQEIAMADIRDAMEELALMLSHRSSLDTLEILRIEPSPSNITTIPDMNPVYFDAQIIPYPSINKRDH